MQFRRTLIINENTEAKKQRDSLINVTIRPFKCLISYSYSFRSIASVSIAYLALYKSFSFPFNRIIANTAGG